VLCAAVAARIRPRAPRCGLFGAEAPLVIAAITPVGDPETMELLANAVDTEAIMADLEERAAEGDQSAKDCLASEDRSRGVDCSRPCAERTEVQIVLAGSVPVG
jgi:hypothetical protein